VLRTITRTPPATATTRRADATFPAVVILYLHRK
jgi:hypothetical protein